jgi:hypothetical protein
LCFDLLYETDTGESFTDPGDVNREARHTTRCTTHTKVQESPHMYVQDRRDAWVPDMYVRAS